jgi:hypothetical protein
MEKNVAVFAINSNDAPSHPGDSPANMRKEIEEWGYTFPYLVDESQRVAKSCEAACTPDFFVFDRDLRRGQAPKDRQLPGIGCNIKWKPGNGPDWFG